MTKTKNTSNGPIAAVLNLTMRFGKLTALDQVSFEVPEGTVFALLGRNGAGKSTLVRCLLGELRPSGGATSLLGADSWKHRHQAMARVGVVPETPDLPADTTGRQMASFFRRLYPTWNGDLFSERLQRFGIAERTPFKTLSKGQKRQLNLALALAIEPQLLILDDPTLGLDAVARKELYEEIIAELADRGTTIFITTHDLAGVEGIASHVAMLHHGRLVLHEELEVLKDRFRRIVVTHPEQEKGRLQQTLDEIGTVTQNRTGNGVEAVVDGFAEEAMQRLAAADASLTSNETMSLEEIFIALCGEERGTGR